MATPEVQGTPGADSFECIVVDDDSTDATAAIATQQGARVLAVSFQQISRVRNAGAAAAGGAAIFFVDADTVVSAPLLVASLNALSKGAVAGGAPFHFPGKYAAVHRLYIAATLAVFRACKLCGGCYIFCRRDAFEAAGGFDEELFAAEEIALIKALKKQGRFALLKVPVQTSPRKMHDFTPGEVARMVLSQALRGRRAFKSREGLDLWYGERRS